MRVLFNDNWTFEGKGIFKELYPIFNAAIRALESVEKADTIFGSDLDHYKAAACASLFHETYLKIAGGGGETQYDRGNAHSWFRQIMMNDRCWSIRISYMPTRGTYDDDLSGIFILMSAYSDRYGNWIYSDCNSYLVTVNYNKVTVKKRTGDDFISMKYSPEWEIECCIPQMVYAAEVPPASLMRKKLFVISQSQSPHGFYEQSVIAGNSLRENDIKRHWGSGRYISCLNYTSLGWTVMLSKARSWTTQIYKKTEVFPVKWVNDKMNLGFMITGVGFSGVSWVTVMTRNTKYESQQVCYGHWDDVKGFIKKWWNYKYYITHFVCVGKDLYLIVMSKTAMYTYQTYFLRDDYETFKKEIKKNWDAQCNITIFERMNDGRFFGVMSKHGTGKAGEIYSMNPANAGKTIEEVWNRKYKVAYIGG